MIFFRRLIRFDPDALALGEAHFLWFALHKYLYHLYNTAKSDLCRRLIQTKTPLSSTFFSPALTRSRGERESACEVQRNQEQREGKKEPLTIMRIIYNSYT
jgi:hypothetical protein